VEAKVTALPGSRSPTRTTGHRNGSIADARDQGFAARLATSQEQALTWSRSSSWAPRRAGVSGDVAERTGVAGLEVLDDVDHAVLPDLMSTPPGEKLNMDMVQGCADGHDRPLRAPGRPRGHHRPAAHATPARDQELAMNITG